jgi:glycosyltransferase involved in cell wall biosynthesis
VINAVGVVIPAHDEQDLLPSCLAAVRRAARQVSVPVYVVVVADACTDRTAELARAEGATVVEARARSVGAARRAGAGQVLRSVRHLDPATLWIATTDADTLVPRCWLSRQLRFASRGWKGVVGTVTVEDWSGHPPHVRRRYIRHYRAWQEHHPHVHGANLGFAADAYLAAGGFRPLPTAEDHALVEDLRAAGIPLLRTTRIPVVTSARARARAPHGFSWLLGTLAGADAPFPGRSTGPSERTQGLSQRRAGTPG